jgi:acyl-CoA synthetase (AMP-forming)/AMP-acid ligase II
VQLRIVDNGREAPAGAVGEIWVRGPAVVRGYLNNVEDSAEAFVGGWFHTGDLGNVDTDGYLFLTGRIKDIINRGGEKISPQTVEAVLLAQPAVQEAVAFAVPDEEFGEDIAAAVVLRPDAQATEADLLRHCRTQLAKFEVPRKVYILDRFPRTAKGDADRRALAAALTSPPSVQMLPS